MAFVYRKSDSPFIWGCWIANGREQRAGMEIGDPCRGEGSNHRCPTCEPAYETAKAVAEDMERRAVVADRFRATPAELTVESFAKGEWLKLRKQSRPFAWRDDQSRLKHHFFAPFGKRPLAWLASPEGKRALRNWLLELPKHNAKRDGKPLGTRTVWNIVSTVKRLFKDAAKWERIPRNPLADFDLADELPRKADKHDGWRQEAGFGLEQVVALTTDKRLDERRQVWNVLAFMCGGARTGEVANLRWSNWTESYKGGLGRLVIAKAFNSREGREKSTKTTAVKMIPIHPYAASVLKAWQDEGWAVWMGRDPKPDDFIVPGSDGKQMRNWKLLDQFYGDCDLLKIDRQRQYESRSTFRNLLLAAGAQEFHVNLLTHPSPKQASDYYSRYELQWPALCEAIMRLDAPAWRVPTVRKVTIMVTAATGTENMKPTAGLEPATYGLRKRCFSSPNDAFQVPDAAGPSLTAPSLAIVPAATEPDDSASLPAVTADLFVQAAAVAAQRSPEQGASLLRRGLDQAGAL